MNRKTILEEMVSDRMGDTTVPTSLPQREEIDKETVSRLAAAYSMMAEGEWKKADLLLDKILEKQPDNEKALTGKLIVKRRNDIHDRMERVVSRLPDEDGIGNEEEPDDYISPKITRTPKKVGANARAPERARMRIIAAMVALMLLVSAVAAVIGITHSNSEEDEPEAEKTVQLG